MALYLQLQGGRSITSRGERQGGVRVPRPPPGLSIQLKGRSDRRPMITSNDLFYAAKGPGEWPSSPKYIAQLNSAPKARKGSTYT